MMLEQDLIRYYAIGLSLICLWILFSTLLVAVICMNSSRLSQIDEPFKDPIQIARERKERLNAEKQG